MHNDNQLKVTSLEDLQVIARGQIVQLPSFGSGAPFVVRMVRPSMLDMIADGSIPNPLIKTASKLFMKGTSSLDEESLPDMKGFTDLLEVICERALVEPTYQQIKDAGVNLTDEQKAAILQYVQRGVNALKSFRKQPKHTKSIDDGKAVQEAAVGDTEDK